MCHALVPWEMQTQLGAATFCSAVPSPQGTGVPS